VGALILDQSENSVVCPWFRSPLVLGSDHPLSLVQTTPCPWFRPPLVLPDFGDTSPKQLFAAQISYHSCTPLREHVQIRNFLSHPNHPSQKRKTPCLSEFQKVGTSRNVKTAEVRKYLQILWKSQTLFDILVFVKINL